MNLKTLRELKGVSRKELAEITGISFRSIQDYEQGHKDLSSAKADTIFKMSRALGCTMEDLISQVDLSALKPSELTDLLNDEGERSQVHKAVGPIVFNLNPADEHPYILMHRDRNVASLVMEPVSGALISVSEVYNEELLPLGTKGPDDRLKAWWQRRAVPITQGIMQKILERIEFVTPQAYLLKNLGLSMEDCYWVKPAQSDLTWRDVNLFQNDFDDFVGALQFAGVDAMIDFRNFDVRFPSSSTHGNMPKTWVIQGNGTRSLVKGSKNGNTQQLFNELVASYIHRKQGKFDFVQYEFSEADYGHGQQLTVSSNAFTSEFLEFIPAADIIREYRKPDVSPYDTFVNACAKNGLDKEQVRSFLDYQILTDFLITNTDRSYENFGVLRDAESLAFVKLAPIFDSGNSMFFDLDMTRRGTLDLKDIAVDSFARNEAGLIRLVRDPMVVDVDNLLTDDELSQVLQSSSRTPEEIRLLVQIYDKKKGLLMKLRKGDTKWLG